MINAAAIAEDIVAQSPTVRFADQTRIPSPQTGRIDRIDVQWGDAVTTTSVIATLDTAAMLSARQSATLKLAAARRRARRDAPVQYAELALQEAEAELEASQLVQRETHGAIATNKMRQLRMSVRRSRLQLEIAQQEKIEAATQADVLAAELSQIEFRIEDARVRSVGDGVVIDLPRRAGEWVTAGDTVAVVARIDQLGVDALVPASSISRQRCTGAEVIATWTDPTSGQGRQLTGRVDRADLQTLPGGRFRIHAVLDNARRAATDQPSGDGGQNEWMLKPGMEITMRIVTGGPVDRLGSIRHRDRR